MAMQRMIATIIYHKKCLKTIKWSSSSSTFFLIALTEALFTAVGTHDVRNFDVSPNLRLAKSEHLVYAVGWQSGVSPYFGQVATQTAAL